MNLEESELFRKELAKNNAQKKAVLVMIILLSVILVILLTLTFMVNANERNRFKIYYNGKELRKYSNTFLYQDEKGNYYLSIEEMAANEGYAYNPGEYKKYEETLTSCNVSKYLEVTSLIADKDYYYKTIDKSTHSSFFLTPYGIENPTEKEMIELPCLTPNGSVETFEVDNPVVLVNEKLYAPLETIRDVFNVRITQGENDIQIFSLNYVYDYHSKKIVDYGYNLMSGDFENVRALVYDLAVVSDGTYQGVVNTNGYESVISTQYAGLQFIQNSKEFLATAMNSQGLRTVGLISAEGATLIKPTQFDEISVLSDKNGLYLVKSGTDYGVLNKKGEVVVYVEYERIGLSNVSDFPLEDITNASILFEKFIPVTTNALYGLYDLSGKETLAPAYNSLGYISTEENTREINVLSIPAEIGMKGIVVRHGEHYGVYDMTLERLTIPCVFEKIYAETKAGVTTYYLKEPGANPVDLALFIEQGNLRTVDLNGNPIQTNQPDNTESVVTDGQQVTDVNGNPVGEANTGEPAINLNNNQAQEQVPESADGNVVDSEEETSDATSEDSER